MLTWVQTFARQPTFFFLEMSTKSLFLGFMLILLTLISLEDLAYRGCELFSAAALLQEPRWNLRHPPFLLSVLAQVNVL